VLAVLAALAVWGLSALVFGVDVRQPAFGPGVPQDLTAGPVVITSLVAGLAAWLALALLERITRHARAAWVALATLVLAASLGAPLSGRGIDEQSRLVLTLLHLTVGALLIVLLARTSPPARSATPKRNR
jgi:apolipoprotein N-acyltransferase